MIFYALYNMEFQWGGGYPPLNLRDIKKDLKKILENYKIEYQIINYDKIKNELSYYKKLITKYIINVSPNNLNKTIWILLSVRNIKSLIITLNTKTDQEIKEYYITLFIFIFYSYLEYTKKFYLNIGESLEKIVR